ncbi:hypothetical protein LCM23_12985 [Cytobacillus kochii]|uniref:hypothetical protein n=1 Tax=Cytobacillus kochii TaxID=859143 RepID=UPI001CD5B59F|nr:hypothetical protein [Cytobacillus kochii]MCA1027009.1 hypothetical protein [Cytobacillus kochii]
MRILEYKNLPELVGKTIAFTHIAQFAENVTIATEDGCVVVITQDVDEDFGEAKQTRVLFEPHARRYIENHKFLRSELGKLGIFNIEVYKKEQEELERKRREKLRIKKEKDERELFEKLKAKYETKE